VFSPVASRSSLSIRRWAPRAFADNTLSVYPVHDERAIMWNVIPLFSHSVWICANLIINVLCRHQQTPDFKYLRRWRIWEYFEWMCSVSAWFLVCFGLDLVLRVTTGISWACSFAPWCAIVLWSPVGHCVFSRFFNHIRCQHQAGRQSQGFGWRSAILCAYGWE